MKRGRRVDGQAGELRSLLSLAVPIVAALTAASMLGLVDSAVVGSLGAVELAAVSLTGSVGLVFVAGLYGFLSPIGILGARAFSAGDVAGVGTQRAAGLRTAVLAGGCSAAAMALTLPAMAHLGQPAEVVDASSGYWLWSAAALLPFALMQVDRQLFDAIERPWLGVGVACAVLTINAVLAIWWVHGGLGLPGFGLAGAGAATFCAYTGGFLLYRGVAWRTEAARHWFVPPPSELALAQTQQRREGAPMGLQYLLECGATAAAGMLVGLFGALALAANQISMSVSMALYMVPLGLAAATGLRVSHAIGSGEQARVRRIATTALVIVAAWMLACGAVAAVAGPWIASAFTDDEGVIMLAATLFGALAAMQVADGIQSVSLGALRGLLDSRWPTRVSLACYWGLALPLAWFLAVPLGLGPAGVWWGFAVGLAVAAVALTRRLLRSAQRMGRA